MRLVNYKVRKANGEIFTTTSYQTATKRGNRIEETFFTPLVEEKTEEQIKVEQEQKEKMRKAWEHMKAEKSAKKFA